jgi:hypothetical protein
MAAMSLWHRMTAFGRVPGPGVESATTGRVGYGFGRVVGMSMSATRFLVTAGLLGSLGLFLNEVRAQTPPIAVDPSRVEAAFGPYDALPSLRVEDFQRASDPGLVAAGAAEDGSELDTRGLREYYRQFPLRRRAQRERERELEPEGGWYWQPLPDGRIFPSYLAGRREPRMAAQWIHDGRLGWLLDGALGGRLGVVRFGDRDSLRPEGFQVDIEGAAFPRVALDDDPYLSSVDFRAGIPLGFRQGPLELKFAYYHYCSHLDAAYAERRPETRRIFYTRDALVWAIALRPVEDLRFYAEADWAFHETGASRPWEFQFGVDYSPVFVTWFRGAPFLAINAHIRQDVDFSGLFTLQTGWQWRGDCGQLLRTGLIYSNGMSDQGQFFSRFEEQIGMGLWFDY